MEQIELKAEPRTLTGRHVKQLRADGYVPAIIYGSQIETTPIQVETKGLHRVLAKAGGNVLIALKIGRKKPVLALTDVENLQGSLTPSSGLDFHGTLKGDRFFEGPGARGLDLQLGETGRRSLERPCPGSLVCSCDDR